MAPRDVTPPPGPASPHPVHRVPSSSIASFIDRGRIDRLLTPWVPSAADRAFVLRCLLDEGPAHHRGANYVILALLGELCARTGGPPTQASSGPTAPVPLRLPPHLTVPEGDSAFALRLALAPLERLAPAGSAESLAMIDCLTDGPPQHALGNAAIVALIGLLLERADRAAGPA